MSNIIPYISENRLINGSFLVDQRNEGATTTPAATAYICDGWKFLVNGLGSDLTFQTQTTTSIPNYLKALSILVASAATPTAAQNAILQQPIEGISVADLGWGGNNAKGLNIVFFIQASITGTYYLSIQNSAKNRSYVTSFSIGTASSWLPVVLNIPGDTTGTWLKTENGVGLYLSFDLGSGSNFNTTVNTWGAGEFYNVTGAAQLVANAAATMFITGVRAFTESANLNFPYVPRIFSLEKTLCQRYFQKTFQVGTAPAQNAGVAGAITVKNPIALGDPSEWWQLTPLMAGSPTIITYNPSATNANWRDITAAADATVSVDPASTKGANGVLIATSGTVTTLGDILAIHATADAGL